MPLPLFALGLDLEKPIQNPCGKLLRRRLPRKRILVKLCQVAFPPVGFALLMSGRFVIELSVVARDTKLLDQTDR